MATTTTVNRGSDLAVFYNVEQTVPDNQSFSPSAGKPAHVVNMYRYNPRVRVVNDWKPLTEDDISVAHDPTYVLGVLTGREKNGFGNTLASVAKSLPYTTGSFFNAAVYAYENNTVAMSPTSGFHHAQYDGGYGFCTFNGLMVAALLLYRDYGVNKIGIIDFDAHYGDGTQEIIDGFDGADKLIEHYTFGKFAMADMDFDRWLDVLDRLLIEQFKDCDILFYQAGADPHINDPLGGFLTTEQMKRRDEIVFTVARKLNKPIVWNLAGGYQKPFENVLTIHQNTLDACIKCYLDASPETTQQQ